MKKHSNATNEIHIVKDYSANNYKKLKDRKCVFEELMSPFV